MKIAVVSENGITISQHFGRAPMYVVMTIENGQIINQEIRNRAANNICACHQGTHDDCRGEHGSHSADPASQAKHAGMADSIADCQVLLAGGMGWGAYESLKNKHIIPIITDVDTINEAVGQFLNGKLVNLMDKLH